ncbi:guanine nucleotide-binding protein-like 3 homolog [Mytilus californianus]|uniref:guanine nucleotide-binding protein-like 3 homolog n=1 Tax=Mytilus californianus TaxID=6549 RepID=UPI002245DD61|nr:guanine nucleotide-binding protein-like 3 homolog [Mytilus californianus]
MSKKQLNRKSSKRQSAKHRYKILKKISQHHKKEKKEKRKNPTNKKKKDPGIPNSLPFKEEILREAEERKRRAEEEREKLKEKRKKDREKLKMKKRNLDGMVKDAQKKTAEFERKQEKKSSGESHTSNGAVENSLKTFYKEFKKVVDAADVILEILDARDPLGSRCTQMEEAILESGTNKRLVLILNKIDLVPRENVEEWLKHLRNEFPTLAFKASTQTQNTNLSRAKVPLQMASDDLLKSSHCLGADMLMKLLGNYCRNKDIKSAIRVGVVGFPNTGKSSIINSLKRAKACNVGAMPGMTRTMQEVHLDKHIKLLDSPGIVMATGTSDTSVILRNCVKLETLDDPITPVEAILKRCSKQQMILHYNIPDYKDIDEFLALLARRMGRLRKGGIPDKNKAARSIIQDWTCGKIKYFTHPPEQHTLPTHVSASLVTQMGKEFSIDDLIEVEQKTLQGLDCKSSKHMLVESLGPAQAIMDDSQLDSALKANEKIDDEEMDNDDGDEESDEMMEDEEEEGEELKRVEVTQMAATRSRKASVTSATSKKSKKSKTSEELLNDSLDTILQQNKKRKDDYKKMRKQRKKADKVSKTLSDTLMGSLTMGTGDDADGDYDFNVLG